MIRKFIADIFKLIATTFSPRYLIWHFVAIAITAIFAFGGLDWKYYQAVQIPVIQGISLLAGLCGFLVPLLVPLIMYFSNKTNTIRRNNAGIVFLAVASSWFISILYKTFTGRGHPGWYIVDVADNSKIFNFGFLKGGVFWGWPSSHTIVAFALGVSIFYLYRNQKWIAALGIFYAIFIAFGAGSGFHWASDALSGVILGTLVGRLAFINK